MEVEDSLSPDLSGAREWRLLEKSRIVPGRPQVAVLRPLGTSGAIGRPVAYHRSVDPVSCRRGDPLKRSAVFSTFVAALAVS